MRRRLPLLRTVLSLTAAFVIAAVALLAFVRVPRLAVAPGRLEAPGIHGKDTLRVAELDPGTRPVPTRFECVVDALDRSSLRPGQSATIRLDAYPWMRKGTLSGRVSAVGTIPLAGGGYAITLTVDPESPPGPLVDGLHGEARIASGETESLGRLLFSRMAKGSL